jgi:hypothetical protein
VQNKEEGRKAGRGTNGNLDGIFRRVHFTVPAVVVRPNLKDPLVAARPQARRVLPVAQVDKAVAVRM